MLSSRTWESSLSSAGAGRVMSPAPAVLGTTPAGSACGTTGLATSHGAMTRWTTSKASSVSSWPRRATGEPPARPRRLPARLAAARARRGVHSVRSGLLRVVGVAGRTGGHWARGGPLRPATAAAGPPRPAAGGSGDTANRLTSRGEGRDAPNHRLGNHLPTTGTPLCQSRSGNGTERRRADHNDERD